MKHTAILFVCMGNICRSPLAEGVLRHLADGAAMSDQLTIDSAGTGGWHAGEGADPRSCESVSRRGYSLAAHRARQLGASDYSDFDWLLAADRSNLATLQQRRPSGATAQLALALPFAGLEAPLEIPDPYYGKARDFDHVVDLAEEFARRVIARGA